MAKRYGVDTDEADKESCEAAEEYIRQQMAEDWSATKLREKYEHLRSVTTKNISHLWPALEFALSIKTILNIRGCTLPFIGIILGPASSNKTVAIEAFRDTKHTFYTDNFSAKSLVSHISGMTEEQLRKIDLLPRLKNKQFLTPELGTMFSLREDDLRQIIGLLTRIADGHGYESDSGAQGHRGYNEDIMFVWTGACVDISLNVHKMLNSLGPKLYFFRLSRHEKTEDDYHNSRSADFLKKVKAIREALFDYLEYFEANPSIVKEEGNPLSKIEMDESLDVEIADRIIIRVGILLAHLRAVVQTWETHDTQGTDYGYTFANIEDPSRAITQLRNLARGHALSQGRTYFTMEDVPVVIHTALSSASMSRVRIFELLIIKGGRLTTNEIVDFLNTSLPTARRTMAELKATELVNLKEENPGQYNSPKEIILKKFEWFLTGQFKYLKEKALDNGNILWKEKCTPEREAVDLPPLSLYDQTITRNVLSLNTPLLGGEISFHQNIIQKTMEIENNHKIEEPDALAPQMVTSNDWSSSNNSKIYNTGVRSGSQLILFRDPMDFFLCKIHPGILDNSIKIEFVTSKTSTSAMVRFLNRQTIQHSYYYSCLHCYDISKSTFGTIDEYERHIAIGHKPGTVGYPGGPDIEKLELERVRRMQSR